VKHLIVLVGLTVSMNIQAESSWVTKGRNLLSSIAGQSISEKVFGKAEIAEIEIKLPKIPQVIKQSTDTASYTKKMRPEKTEFDKLPEQRQRQFDYKFIEELFQVTRKSEARDEDLASWLNTLDQGGSREGIYQALVLDEVYATLENIEENPSNKLVEFCQKYSETFLNQTFKADSLKQLNLYSLKRILTEKSLDLLEYYEVHDLNDLDQWYASFSAYMGAHYGGLLRTELRQANNPEYHFKWAQSMPVQHVKSEMIIKLHLVMNALQHLE